MTDARLVQEARGGDRDAFRQLVERHQGWLVRYLLHLLGDPGAAEDVAQEALVQARQQLRGLLDAERFKPWLRTIATRAAFNRRRGARRRRSHEEAVEPVSRFGAPDDLTEARDTVHKVLQHLEYPSREILVMHYLEELTIGEISDTLRIGESAAKMRLKRARDDFYVRHDQMAPNAR